jgi:IS6 family transposase
VSIFSGRHFPKEVILWAVRWYCRYGVSYRDLEEMLTERGVAVDHTTIYGWVQRCRRHVKTDPCAASEF